MSETIIIFSNPYENVRQPKALPDIDMLLFYTIRWKSLQYIDRIE